MKEAFNAVVAAAGVVEAYLPVAKQRLDNMGMPKDNAQYQALEGMTVGVKHVEADFSNVNVPVFQREEPVENKVPVESLGWG